MSINHINLYFEASNSLLLIQTKAGYISPGEMLEKFRIKLLMFKVPFVNILELFQPQIMSDLQPNQNHAVPIIKFVNSSQNKKVEFVLIFRFLQARLASRFKIPYYSLRLGIVSQTQVISTSAPLDYSQTQQQWNRWKKYMVEQMPQKFSQFALTRIDQNQICLRQQLVDCRLFGIENRIPLFQIAKEYRLNNQF